MNEFLPFIIIGLVTGSVYGLAGTGLVLTYKTSGIFNFAYGSVAAVAVFFFYSLNVTHGLPWPVAALICVGVVAPIMGLLLELMARAIERQGTPVKVVATIGVLLVVLGVGNVWYGDAAVSVPQYLPTSTFRLLGVNVAWSQAIVFAVAAIGAASLYAFFKYVRLGIAMRAIVDDPDLIAYTGESPTRVRRLAWIIGTCFAAIAGLLVSPSLGVDATVITLLVVQAFGAAAIGYFSSLPLTFMGGLVVGLLGSFSAKYTVDYSWLSGLTPGIPFILLFVVLIVTPKHKLAERRARHALSVTRSWHAPFTFRAGALLLAVVGLGLIPLLVSNVQVWTGILVEVIMFLSLGLLIRLSGQVSLCHLTFAAVGAVTFAQVSDSWQLPWLPALLIAGAAAIPIGALVAIPAIRLPGVFLALATLGLGILVQNVFYNTDLMFGPTAQGLEVPLPQVSIFGLDLSSVNGYYYVVLAAVVVTGGLVMAIERGRMGRLLRALGDSATALEVQGVNVKVTRTVVFCVSAAIAGVAGALQGGVYGYALALNYQWFLSLQLAVLVVIVIGGTPWYALMAGLGAGMVLAYVHVNGIADYLFIAFGSFAIMYAVQGGKGQPVVPQKVRRWMVRVDQQLTGRWRRTGGDEPTATLEDLMSSGRHPAVLGVGDGDADRPTLEVQNVSVHYGGVVALRDVSLTAKSGMITGLVGPNGAGKTTLFNACSGLLRPATGRILLSGDDMLGNGPAKRAEKGLGRTFQRTELFDSISVRENVAMGREGTMAGGNPVRQLVTKRGDRAEVADAVHEAMVLAGIDHLADEQAGLLTTGQRRLVEFARVLAGPFDMVLLDEPSAGLDSDESNRFSEIVRRVVELRGIGVLIVEHDISLVRQLCDHIYVLDFGELVFEGSAADMLDSEVVKAAYLGGATEDPVTSGGGA